MIQAEGSLLEASRCGLRVVNWQTSPHARLETLASVLAAKSYGHVPTASAWFLRLGAEFSPVRARALAEQEGQMHEDRCRGHDVSTHDLDDGDT